MDLWQVVTVSSGFSDEIGMQVVVRGTVAWIDDVGTTQVSGQVNLQERPGTEFFCIGFDGTVATDGSHRVGVIDLPADATSWKITVNLVQTQSAGRPRQSLIVSVAFLPNTANGTGLQRLQFTFPILPDNAKRAKLFHSALVHANDRRANAQGRVARN